ncbi:DUF1488 family protein [Caballeronia sp. LP006]|uniref:DUF1488 family protein n=1 Tax=Caballeronia sp. LP006 TaxID=3038552 RepID=UPI0028630CE7|nr:DUF1488 family protein [Caballeronia sp. LP006]MDR5832269.1 DUF1488 family protein [Caballeronia sp. LP006]
MELPINQPPLRLTKRGVEFSVMRNNQSIACVMKIEALQQFFWLEPSAADQRILRCFLDGRARIFAVAERKTLTCSDNSILLTAKDFRRR